MATGHRSRCQIFFLAFQNRLLESVSMRQVRERETLHFTLFSINSFCTLHVHPYQQQTLLSRQEKGNVLNEKGIHGEVMPRFIHNKQWSGHHKNAQCGKLDNPCTYTAASYDDVSSGVAGLHVSNGFLWSLTFITTFTTTTSKYTLYSPGLFIRYIKSIPPYHHHMMYLIR